MGVCLGDGGSRRQKRRHLYAEHRCERFVLAEDHYEMGARVVCSGDETTIRARHVINAAGVESDRIHNMVAPPAFGVPTRGEYYILDGTAAGHVVRSVVFPCPTRAGKGVTILRRFMEITLSVRMRK